MIYQSEIDVAHRADNLQKRMKLYLTSKSIDEYKIQRDLEGLKPKWHLPDIFLLWYIYSERYIAFIASIFLCGLGFSLISFFILRFFGLLWIHYILSIIAIVFICILVVIVFRILMDHLGSIESKEAIMNYSSGYSFAQLDKHISNEMMQELK